MMVIGKGISLVMSWVEGFADSPSIPDSHSPIMSDDRDYHDVDDVWDDDDDDDDGGDDGGDDDDDGDDDGDDYDDGDVDDDHPWFTFTNHVWWKLKIMIVMMILIYIEIEAFCLSICHRKHGHMKLKSRGPDF